MYRIPVLLRYAIRITVIIPWVCELLPNTPDSA